MPSPLVAGDVLNVVIACYVAEPKQLGESRVRYRVVTPGGVDLEDMPRFFRNLLKTPYKAWLPLSATFAGVSVQRILPSPRSGTISSLDGSVGLAGDVGYLPTQVSGLLTYKTAGIAAVIAGDPPVVVSPALPGTHGRSYVPFPATTWFDPETNSLTGSAVTKLAAIRTRLGPTLTLGGAQLQQIVLRGTKQFDVISSEPSELFATQRKRGAYGQLNRPFGA